MLSTMHGAELAEVEKVGWKTVEKKKPKCVLEYHKKKGTSRQS